MNHNPNPNLVDIHLMTGWKDLLQIGQIARSITRWHKRCLGSSRKKSIASCSLSRTEVIALHQWVESSQHVCRRPAPTIMSPPRSPQLVFIVAPPTTPTSARAPHSHPGRYCWQRYKATRATTSSPTPPAMELCYEWAGRVGSPGLYSVLRLSGFRAFVLSLISYYFNVHVWS